MQPFDWQPPVALSEREEHIVQRIRRAKLFVFLRHHRHELFERTFHLVLDCLDTDQAPFSKGTFVAFRKRLIDAQMDRRLIERTIELASQNQEVVSRALRAALDSSPLWGAGRVEDTYNLIGHALKKMMCVVAEQQGRDMVEVG